VKKALLAFLVAAFCSNSFALDTEIKGFLALDLLILKKIEGRQQELVTGIGVLDLKAYATQDDFSGKIKLDLDNSKINEKYNLFEEASAAYRISDFWSVSAGKGVVPFHRLHWGVIENTYIDSGSVIGSKNAWRDVDKKLFLGTRLGSFRDGYLHHFTFWGESKLAKRDRAGNLDLTSTGQLQYENSKTFSTKDERGLAYKFELFPDNVNSLSAGLIYYWNDYIPRESWAFDTGWRYRDGQLEVWLEYLYGFKSTHSGDSYATAGLEEHFLQLGAEQYISELINILANVEVLFVEDERHTERGTTLTANDGRIYEYDQVKVEAGVKFKLSKAAFITVGALLERQIEDINGVENSDAYAYEGATKLSFWF
jgi:hypothetical protein